MPGLALVAACRAIGARDVRWIGDPERLEAKLLPAHDIPLLPHGLSRPRIRKPGWWLQALKRAWHCYRALSKQPPRAVIALGGYAALLPGLLAPWLRRPLVVCEQNAWPGRTNRLLARCAQVVVTQFPEAKVALPAARVRCLGNPVRHFPAQVRGQGNELCVLVMGGSLAAKSINDALVAAAPDLAQICGLRILHLAGEADAERMRALYTKAGISAEVHGFITDMAPIYAQADIALCRAGATTVSECRTAGPGAIYVPLPWAAEDHQTANARAVARGGGAVVLPQAAVNAASLTYLLRRCCEDRRIVTKLGEAAAAQAHPHAATHVATMIQGMVGQTVQGQVRW